MAWVVVKRERLFCVVPDVGITLDACPCCDAPLLSERAARLVGEAVFGAGEVMRGAVREGMVDGHD